MKTSKYYNVPFTDDVVQQLQQSLQQQAKTLLEEMKAQGKSLLGDNPKTWKR